MSDAETVPSGPVAPPLPRRLVDVFFSPGRLFAALAADPRWLGAVLVGAAVATVAVALIPAELWIATMREAMLERGQPLPDDFGAGSMASIQKAFAVGGTAVAWFVMVFLLAAVSTFLFVFVLGDRGSYRRHLSVVAHALVITAVGSLLVTPLRLLQEDPQLTLNLGLFVPLEDGFVASFLSFMDLFWLWTFVVVGIGVHELDRRRSVAVAVSALMVVPVGFALLSAWLTGR